jgi:hypothetical protein
MPSYRRSEIPRKFRHVVLEKNGDQLDGSCENEEVLQRVKEERNILHAIKRRKANWVGHLLSMNSLIKTLY